MVYGNKFYGYGVATESSINSFDSNSIIMEDMNYIDELMKSLNESYITEASFGDVIKGIFSTIGKVITKILSFVKDKLLKFLEKIKGFFDGLVNKISKMESDIDNDSSDKLVATNTAYDKEVQTVANGLKDLSDAFDDLRATQMNAAQNIINAHKTANEYIKQTSEQIRKNSEEFDKTDEKINKKMEDIDKLLNSLDDDSDSNSRSSSTTMTINIKSYSVDFHGFLLDYEHAATNDLINKGVIDFRLKRTIDDSSIYAQNDTSIKDRDEYIDSNTQFINKWSKMIKPFKEKPSSCFVIKDQKVSFLSKGNPLNPNKANKIALNQGSNMFKIASKDFAQHLKNVKSIESYLSDLKKKLDRYGKEMKSSTADQEAITFSKPLIASETKYYKDNINICSFIIKQVMDGISTNVVAGMKFYILAKGYIYG